MNGRALVAMSGGVDSSVAAWLMVGGGYECMGATMKLFDDENMGIGVEVGAEGENSCCSASNTEDARAVAYQLGIPFYVFNFADTFEEQVIRRFIRAYQSGFTPNPCIDCNRHMKFGHFLRRAREIGCGCIATGHYARIEQAQSGGRHLLRKGLDATKDQSYVLYMMTQDHLEHTAFPLGGLTKAEVREIARGQGFANAQKRESQDICFVPGGDYAGFIEAKSGGSGEQNTVITKPADDVKISGSNGEQNTFFTKPAGDAKKSGSSVHNGYIIDLDGNILGEHKGFYHYTIGQRRGLGLPAAIPLYVNAVRPKSNTVVVGPEEALYSKTLIARDINLIVAEKLDAPLKVRAKIRYRQEEQPATVWQLGADELRIEFDCPQRAITKGQAVVLYDGDYVVGGGTIC